MGGLGGFRSNQVRGREKGEEGRDKREGREERREERGEWVPRATWTRQHLMVILTPFDYINGLSHSSG